MESKDYKVARIEGEYAILENLETGAEVFIAMSLLPMGIDIGTKLHYECFEYTISN